MSDKKPMTVEEIAQKVYDEWQEDMVADVFSIKEALLTFAAQEAEPLVEVMRTPCYCAPANWFDKTKPEQNGHYTDCPYQEALTTHRAKYPRKP